MKNDSNLRVILAVAVSFAFLAIYSHYFANSHTPAAASQPAQQEPISQSHQETPKLNKAPQLQDAARPIHKEEKPLSRIVSKDFEIEIDSLGRISQVYLKQKKYTANAHDIGFFDHIKILLGMMKKPETKEKLPLLQAGSLHPLELRFEDETLNHQAYQTSYTASQPEISLDTQPQTLILTQNLQNVTIKKILTFYDNLKYDIKIEVSNPNVGYFLSNGARPLTDQENYAFNGVILQKSDEKIEKIEDKDSKDSKDFSQIKFIASVDRYFTTLFFDPKGAALRVVVDSDASKNPLPYVYAKGDLNLVGYIGPKDYKILKGMDVSLTRVIEYGLITFFAKPIFLLLDFLHHHIGNWGWSIIVLTIIIKLILYPLSYKGMVSMQKLKDLTPKMKEIQDKYKGDPQKLQMHMMQLYKKHGANPLGGCFPLIIQIPIFYAIYRVLYNSVELKSAEFIFWIHDLSAMDPFLVLPILMGISMYIQQHLTPSGLSDPIQAKMFKLLPLFFTIFLIFFPAGLVLYWTINNILSIFQQLSINKMLDRQKQKEILEHKKIHHKDLKNEKV